MHVQKLAETVKMLRAENGKLKEILKENGLAEPTDMAVPESEKPMATETENVDVEWLRAQCEQLRSELKKQDEAWQSAWLDNSRLRDINNGLRRTNQALNIRLEQLGI